MVFREVLAAMAIVASRKAVCFFSEERESLSVR